MKSLPVLAAAVVLGGCQTSLYIETDPPHSSLVLQKSGVRGVSGETMELPARVFKDGMVTEENVRLAAEGYHDLEVPVALRRGRANHFESVFALEPIITTLEVLTEPEGASVEDMSIGGFGYLGQTPLNYSFDWNEVSKWAEVVEMRRGSHKFQAVKMDLRVERAGYATVVMEDVLVPVGERRSYKRTLRSEGEIAFTSEPDGVTVYVLRRDNGVEYKKRLGTTPFPYTDDEPLEHGETLYWEKTGFVSERTPYVTSNRTFHAVLTPRQPVSGP